MVGLKIIIFLLTVAAFCTFKKLGDSRMLITGIGAAVLFAVLSVTFFTAFSIGNMLWLLTIVLYVNYKDNPAKLSDYVFPIGLLAILAYDIALFL